MLMGECDDPQVAVMFNKDNRIRKTLDGYTPGADG